MADGSIVLRGQFNTGSKVEERFDRIFGIKLRPGNPDRTLLTNHGPIAIEIKKNGDRLRPSQLAVAEEFVHHNWPFIIVRFFQRTTNSVARGPEYIFTFQRYIGNGCLAGMTLEQFQELLGDPDMDRRLRIVDAKIPRSTKYESYRQSMLVGPVYQTTSKVAERQINRSGNQVMVDRGENTYSTDFELGDGKT